MTSETRPPQGVNPVILFEPDGYAVNGPKLMGRQAAGHGFLRALVQGCRGEPFIAYTPKADSAAAFRELVAQIDPAAQTQWLPANRLELIGDRGLFYRPDLLVGESARARLRVGLDRYSLCGVTHTLATSSAMAAVADLLVAPMAPWDAVICTSSAAVGVIESAWAAQADYLSWRFGGEKLAARPRLPVIPLGVHCEDFDVAEAERAAARARLGLAEDEVAALFAGRLSFNGKAHPYAMYVALQEVATRTGAKLVLIQAGKFHSALIEQAYRAAAAQACPDVRTIFVDGGDGELYRASWAASDLFISLSDSIQETFGLTPVEAMAAGLPVVVTDWNGYKDTVREGVDGFRISTWAPQPGSGESTGREYEVGALSYDFYLSRASTVVSVDIPRLVERLADLVVDSDLRRRLGAAGRARARQVYDWSVIFAQYQTLWTEQTAIRLRARDAAATLAWIDAAPAVAPTARDPYATFAGYPTSTVSPDTQVRRRPGASADRYAALTGQPIFRFWTSPPELVGQVLNALGDGGQRVEHLAQATAVPVDFMVELVSRLAKMDLVELRAPGDAARDPR